MLSRLTVAVRPAIMSSLRNTALRARPATVCVSRQPQRFTPIAVRAMSGPAPAHDSHAADKPAAAAGEKRWDEHEDAEDGYYYHTDKNTTYEAKLALATASLMWGWMFYRYYENGAVVLFLKKPDWKKDIEKEEAEANAAYASSKTPKMH